MRPTILRCIEIAVEREDASEAYYREALQALIAHARELRGFVGDLVEHLNRPGPSPEKTAEHYQIADRARKIASECWLDPVADHRSVVS